MRSIVAGGAWASDRAEPDGARAVARQARPEFTPPWPARSNLTTVQLARLTKPQAREMVATLGGSALPADTLDALVARADGVPLYVEELTKAMVEPGVARGVEAIPATLADSLMARLDRLSAAKEVAQRAAVLGREFSYPLLAAVAGLEDAALRYGLARLVEAEIVFVRGEPPEAMYTFKHALVQEAAYGSLLKRTRQQLHGRVADVLVAEFPERAAAEPEVVARHAELAGRIDEAIAAYQRAGEQAQARSAFAEAIRHLRHAIALLTTQPEGRERDTREIPLQLALGHSLQVTLGMTHVEVEAAFERVCVLCEATGDASHRLGFALNSLAELYKFGGQLERASALGARMLAIAEQSGDWLVAFFGHYQIGYVEYYQGKFASSLAHCEATQALSPPGGWHAAAPALGVWAPGMLALAGWNLPVLGWPDRALTRARKAEELARQMGHPFFVASALYCEAKVHWHRRDATAQRECAAEVIALSEAHGFPMFLGLGRTYHAAARVAAGEPEAIADLLAGIALAAENGMRPVTNFALLGEAYTTTGQLGEARGTIEKALAVAAQTGQPFFDAELHRLRGEIVLATGGSPAEAEASFHQALDIARAQEAKSFELRAATSLARLWRDQGKRAAARDLLAPTYSWFTEGFDTRDLIDAKVLLVEL